MLFGKALELFPVVLFYGLLAAIGWMYVKDKYQSQHAILKTHPIVGRLRYLFEMIGPELRQYIVWGDKEGRPIDRDTQSTIAKAGKYGSTVIGFGSKKDFSRSDFYLSNALFPKNMEELHVLNAPVFPTYLYRIVNETVVSRKEKRHTASLKPWHLPKTEEVVIGPCRPHPFAVQGHIGISAMSYGALSKSAVKAIAQGVALSGGSFMNTGEGGISPYHLGKMYLAGEKEPAATDPRRSLYLFVKEHQAASTFDLEEAFFQKPHLYFMEDLGRTLKEMSAEGYLIEKETPLIFQVGSGLFGARKEGVYDEETFLSNALRPEVKAIEIKLAQGAKVRGGKLPKEKITAEIAAIRGIQTGKDVESPNRFPLFHNTEELFALIERWQQITGKPVGIKVVAGSEDTFEELAALMRERSAGPDFIALDGGEGGTGATYQEMADTLGLPLFSGLLILHDTLVRHGVRDRVTVIASGQLATADKMAIALSLGADLIYIARAAMNTVGCLNSFHCDSNHCPVGVTSHLPHLESGLVVSEKRFRTANYLATMRQGLFMLAASCGIDSPSHFNRSHVTFRDQNASTVRMDKSNTL